MLFDVLEIYWYKIKSIAYDKFLHTNINFLPNLRIYLLFSRRYDAWHYIELPIASAPNNQQAPHYQPPHTPNN